VLGYLLSRGPGLPDYSDDIGNWAEPLGMASLLIEGCLVMLASYRLSILSFGRSTTHTYEAMQRSRLDARVRVRA